jgi:hypothetical protein
MPLYRSFTQFAEFTSTDCKYSGISKKNVIFGQKSPEKGSMRRSIVVMQHPVLLSGNSG